MNTLFDLMDQLGGPGAIERDTNIPASHVRQMRLRNSIPVRHWPAFMEAARKTGIELTEADLLRLHVPAATVPTDTTTEAA